MRGEQVAFLGWYIYRFKELIPVLDEHLDDQEGQILPHLLMADIGRWILDRFSKAGPRDSRLLEMLAVLEECYGIAGEQVSELVAVSFLENLPRMGEEGSELRSLLGPGLKEQLKAIG